MTIALIRGYTNCGFEAWTVPCLYVAGKYMRIFAIKADEGAASTSGSVTNFDDFNPEGPRARGTEGMRSKALGKQSEAQHSQSATGVDREGGESIPVRLRAGGRV